MHDDGIGIRPDSLEKYVGTDHCTSSSSMYLPVHIEPICNQTPCIYIEKEKHGIICPQQHFLIEEGKREFLKALTSMCEEVNIVSKCIVPCPDGKYSHKLNRKKRCHNERDNREVMCTSEKYIVKGVNIKCHTFFAEVDGKSKKNATGTAESVKGLFHRHAVRKRHDKGKKYL